MIMSMTKAERAEPSATVRLPEAYLFVYLSQRPSGPRHIVDLRARRALCGEVGLSAVPAPDDVMVYILRLVRYGWKEDARPAIPEEELCQRCLRRWQRQQP